MHSPIICQCQQIRRDEIVSAILAGAETLADLRAQTHANTGCTRCRHKLERLIALTLQQGDSPSR